MWKFIYYWFLALLVGVIFNILAKITVKNEIAWYSLQFWKFRDTLNKNLKFLNFYQFNITKYYLYNNLLFSL